MTAPPREFTLIRDFDAPRELVFRAWTEPEHMAQWLMPHGVTTPQNAISQDLRVGGLWRWTMVNERDGTRYPTVAQFREIVEPERLVFTWGGEDTQRAVITVRFAEHAGGTQLTLHLAGLAEMLTEDAEVREGWTECLDNLQTFLKRRVEQR